MVERSNSKKNKKGRGLRHVREEKKLHVKMEGVASCVWT